jgi:hypothetical protein
MGDNSMPTESGYASPEEMRGWLLQEIRDTTRSIDLRLKEATGFVEEYSNGTLSPEQAAERFFRYRERWGEALFGATAGKDTTDAQILAAIDEAHKNQRVNRLARPKSQLR